MVPRPGNQWQCEYCGQTGSLEQLRSTPCAHFYPQCDDCGGHPYCEPDCPGIAEILKDPGNYKIGF